jgi:RNA polymerase sigma-70 factor (ECF subfamily)
VHAAVAGGIIRMPPGIGYTHFTVPAESPHFPGGPPPVDPFGPLVEAIQAGRDVERNSELLYQRTYQPVCRMFQRWGFTTTESEDLTQETFFRVFKNIDRFRHDSWFKTWLYQIVKNICRNERRRRRASVRRDACREESLDELLEADAGRVASLASSEPSAEQRALGKEGLEELRRAFLRLPKQMRECFYLRLVKHLKYREIAEVKKVSIETVKAHLHQARHRLRSLLTDPALIARLMDAHRDADRGDP